MEENKFTLESVRQFLLEHGGVCSNHVLVAKFKPFLSHSVYKLENRNKLKEFVQLLTSVETKNGEKVLVLKKRYNEQGCFNLMANQERGPVLDTSEAPDALSIPEAFLSTRPQGDSASIASTATVSDISDFSSTVAPASSIYHEMAPSNIPVADKYAPSSYERRDSPTPIPAPRSKDRIDGASSSSNKSGFGMGFYSAVANKKSIADTGSGRESPVRSETVSENVSASTPPPPAPWDRCTSSPGPKHADNDVPASAINTPQNSQFNSETLKKSPMSAKERIRHFNDKIVVEQTNDASSSPVALPSRRSNKDRLPSSSHMNNHAHQVEVSDYDSVAIVSLDAKEKEWMLTSASCDYPRMFKLLDEQPDLAHRRDFITGYNAMHWAAKHGKPEVIKMLNRYQVDANLRSYCGYTPVHLAAMGGNEECIDLLINLCKVTPSTRDFYGKRPKQYLKKNCSTRIQQMLLNSAKPTFAVGATIDDANTFARTQSFSAKIMKTTQGLARKFSNSSRAFSEQLPDTIREAPETAPEDYRKSLRSFPMAGKDDTDGLENYTLARSGSAPDFPPFRSDSQTNMSGFTNLREF